MGAASSWAPTFLPATIQAVGGRRSSAVTAVREGCVLITMDPPLRDQQPVHLQITPRPNVPPLAAKGTVIAVYDPGPEAPGHDVFGAPPTANEVLLDDPSPEIRELIAGEIEAASRRRRIAAVDDDLLQLALLRKVLSRLGFDPVCVSTPIGAVHVIAQLDPHLILLDINMPGLDGREVCKQLRKEERTKNVPVVFISGLGSDEIQAAVAECGGDGYVEKGASVNEIIAEIHRHL